MNNTEKKEIILPSGVRCVVGELFGKHQRILTQQNKDFGENMDEVLLDIVLELGDKKSLSMDDILGMLAPDRQMALIQSRHLTMGIEEPFKYSYEYFSEITKRKEKYQFEMDFVENGDFPFETVKRFDESTQKYVDASYTSYKEIEEDKIKTIILPKSGFKVKFRMLDGRGERIATATKKSMRSTHLPIMMRSPKQIISYETDGRTKEQEIVLDLDKLHLKDIEFLRQAIHNFEGRVNSEVSFRHPETDEIVYINALATVAFFFPSEMI